MTTRVQSRNFPQTPDLSLSDSEESDYSSDEEMPDREETNQMLRQAHHYVITEGGKDSPSLYMQRIQRIHRSLIQEISAHSYDCDLKLYRRVKQKIDHVLREFEDAVDVDASIHDDNETTGLYTATIGKALYRGSSSPVTPDEPTAHLHTKRGGKDNLQKTYLYGGPENHPEIWHKNAPASLLFPETIRMAEWESLRVHWDLATTGDMERKEPVTGNAVSFNDPRLQHLNHLTQYESGSRFTLPAIDPKEQAKVNDFCTVARLTSAVNAFNKGDDSMIGEGQYVYAPRVFLQEIQVGTQASPTDRKSSEWGLEANKRANHTAVLDDVRKAMNTTPTKTRRASASRLEPTSSHTIAAEQYNDLVIDKSSPVSQGTHTPILESTPQNDSSVSSAVRRIRAATKESIRSSNLPQSPPLPSATEALPVKRPLGRPRNQLLSASASPHGATHQTKATGKRKKLSVDIEEARLDTEAATVHAKRARIIAEPARPYTPIMDTQSDSLPSPMVTPALTLGSMSASSVASTPPLAKARSAGRKQRKIRTKHDFEERVTPERYAEIMSQRKKVTAQGHESVTRGSTRSGRQRKM